MILQILIENLRAFDRKLIQVPDRQKSWHPGSPKPSSKGEISSQFLRP